MTAHYVQVQNALGGTLLLARGALTPLLSARACLRLELLRLLLLLDGEHREDVGVQPRFLDSRIGLHGGQRRRGLAHGRFVHRHLVDGRALRLHRLLHPLHRPARLLAVALHDVAHLLLLRVAQVELTEREARREPAPARAAGPERPRAASRLALREERHGAGRDEGDEPRRHNDLSNTIHGYSLQRVRRRISNRSWSRAGDNSVSAFRWPARAFITQRVDRVQPRGLAGRIETEEHADRPGDAE